MCGEYEQLRQVCVELALLGVEVARRMQSDSLRKWRKSDRTLVTAADEAAQRAIVQRIAERFPDDAVIAEEACDGGTRPCRADAARFWIIDPIDGTRNYARGAPFYCCSVAVADSRRPIAGAVAEAAGGMVFSASLGGGAWLGDRRLVVRDEPLHRETFIGIPSRHRRSLPETVRNWANEHVVRNYGSTALHLCMVAAGMLDAAFVMDSNIWDVAAGGLAVLEAGGVITDHQGRPLFPTDIAAHADRQGGVDVLAAGPRCHANLLRRLAC